MSNQHGDINDDEIRIISSGENNTGKKKRKVLPYILWVIVSLVTIVAIAITFFSAGEIEDETHNGDFTEQPTSAVTTSDSTNLAKNPSFTSKRDTVVNGIGLTILTPNNATPVLAVGYEAINDSTAVLMAQAADVRRDNGGIVGSFVVNGELISKGESKAGFCSIVNGNVTLGVADATPLFEQALISNGYFFRQYPLVVGGQIVENKPKGKSIRKALVELNGKISVVVSRERLTFHDFSQTLTDIGVNNAIYLVGGDAYGRYVDANGTSFSSGSKWDKKIFNMNFIIWQ